MQIKRSTILERRIERGKKESDKDIDKEKGQVISRLAVFKMNCTFKRVVTSCILWYFVFVVAIGRKGKCCLWLHGYTVLLSVSLFHSLETERVGTISPTRVKRGFCFCSFCCLLVVLTSRCESSRRQAKLKQILNFILKGNKCK